MATQPRGLHNFIADIRNASSKEDERMRVDKELANIRQKFSASSNLNSYQKKKYVWKMCYIYMLGYDVDFGHIEMISLLTSSKFQEKSVGYMAVALLLKPSDEMMTLVVNSMRNDVIGNLHHGQTLALSAIANIGSVDLAEALAGDVQRLISEPAPVSMYSNPNTVITAEMEARNRSLVRKKACLCLLRLYRSNTECIDITDWAKRINNLLEERDLGVITSLISLLHGFAIVQPNDFEVTVPSVIGILNRLVVSKNCSADYMYYKTPSPWLQVKCLRFLQLYRPPDDANHRESLFDALKKILTKTEVSDSINKSNADHSVLFEAVSLLITYGSSVNSKLHSQAIALLGRFISVKDANIRYLGLDTMGRLAKQDGPSSVQSHQSTVIMSLKDADVSVRKRALSLLFVMTDGANAKQVVEELLLALPSSDSAIKEEMVVKIAILAEQFAVDFRWYLDTTVQAITVAGDFVSEDVWHRIVQIVTNQTTLQSYAAEKSIQIAQSKWAHEIAIALSAYLLGEFGVNICEEAGRSGLDQFNALHQHFPRMTMRVQCLMLTCYAKLVNLYPECRAPVHEVFSKLARSGYLELQQRACEYLRLADIAPETMEFVLDSIPAYAEDKQSPLLTRMQNEGLAPEKHTWSATMAKTNEGSGEGEGDGEDGSSGSGSGRKGSLGGGGGFGTPPSATSAPAALMDLLSMDDVDTPPPVPGAPPPALPASNAVGLAPEELTRLHKHYLAFLTLPAGKAALFFEGSVLRINCAAEFRSHLCRFSVNFANISPTLPISELKLTHVHNEDINILVMQNPAPRLEPGGGGGESSCRVQLQLECMKPFLESPKINVSYVCAGVTYAYTMSLPVTVASFCEAVPLDSPSYLTRWKALEGEEREAQEVFATNHTVNAELMTKLKEQIFPVLHFGLAAGLDSEVTATGCCSFRTNTMSPDGSGPVVVGALIRIEADVSNKRFRVTVRAKHGKVAVALKNAVKLILS